MGTERVVANVSRGEVGVATGAEDGCAKRMLQGRPGTMPGHRCTRGPMAKLSSSVALVVGEEEEEEKEREIDTGQLADAHAVVTRVLVFVLVLAVVLAIVVVVVVVGVGSGKRKVVLANTEGEGRSCSKSNMLLIRGDLNMGENEMSSMGPTLVRDAGCCCMVVGRYALVVFMALVVDTVGMGEGVES